MRWTAAELPSLAGRTAVVTGGNSGIGAQVCSQLAVHGAHVVLACRNLARAEEYARHIRATDPSATVEVSALDLASMHSIQEFAARWDGPLDLLINNAGVMAPPKRTTTPDGFELQFGTNHLGHFVLTGLLLPALLSRRAARVVTVSSLSHHSGGTDVVDANAGGRYNPEHTYANSKLANLLFSMELQRQLTKRSLDLSSTAAHPGLAATGLAGDREGLGRSRILGVMGTGFLKIFGQSPADGAASVLYAATVAEPGSYSGPQRWREMRGAVGRARVSPVATDETMGRRLWEVSEELTGFRYPWP